MHLLSPTNKQNTSYAWLQPLSGQSHPFVVSVIYQIPSLKPLFINLFSKYLMSIRAVLGTWETDNKMQFLVGEASEPG